MFPLYGISLMETNSNAFRSSSSSVFIFTACLLFWEFYHGSDFRRTSVSGISLIASGVTFAFSFWVRLLKSCFTAGSLVSRAIGTTKVMLVF